MTVSYKCFVCYSFSIVALILVWYRRAVSFVFVFVVIMLFSNEVKCGNEIGIYNGGDMCKTEFKKAIKAACIYGVPTKKTKRCRSAFKTEQVNYLEKEFAKYPYIGNARRKDVANVLDIPEKAVKIWFQNRRMKKKREATNKESDSDRYMEVNESLNNVCSLKSTNNASLPIISVSTSQTGAEVKENTLRESKYIYKNLYFKNNRLSAKQNTSKADNSPRSSTAPADSLRSLKKDKSEKNNTVSKEINKVDHFTNIDQVQDSSNPGRQLKLGYLPYDSPASDVPQDLSSKSAAQSQKTRTEKESPEVKLNPVEVPFYLKEYCVPSCIAQGNMIWKPVNMAPIMAPALTISSPDPAVSNQNMTKNCNCDCNKYYVSPMMVPNNTNVQYVIAAVPFSNSSPKI